LREDPRVSVRKAVVGHALWGVRNNARIHYAQTRPIDGIGEPRKLPLSTDCSGFVTDCYAWAGAPDPNGRRYDGLGYTGTLLAHCRHIRAAALQLGDLVVFGPGTGEHVVVVVRLGRDPLVVGHGGEAGPVLVRLSKAVAFHRSPVTYLDGLAPASGAVVDDELGDASNPSTEQQ
jgi:hypothetical protein